MSNRGGVNSLIAVLMIGLLALVLLTALGLMGRTRTGTKKVVALSVAADTAWTELENALKPRFTLIPGLVEAVRGYATDHQELFTRIADAQRKYASAGTPADKVEAANEVESYLAQLLALQEQYPKLTADEIFHALTVALQGTEPAVSTARTRYNDVVRALDEYTKTPFAARLAKETGIQPRPYFQVAEQTKTEVPNVDFSKPNYPPVPTAR